MTNNEIVGYAIVAMIGIIGYFLNGVISNVKAIENRVNKHETKIEIIEVNHNSLDKRFDELNSSLKELTKCINQLMADLNRK